MHSVAYDKLRLRRMRNASNYDDLEEFIWEAEIRSQRQDDTDFTSHYDEFWSYGAGGLNLEVG